MEERNGYFEEFQIRYNILWNQEIPKKKNQKYAVIEEL